MPTHSYLIRRNELRTYFDRTAVEAWARLTSDAPVGRIRRTVRAGRDQMRDTLLGWLPEDLDGHSVLDAGCGTGALSVACSRRGAAVTAIDLSPTLVDLARERAGELETTPGNIAFGVGDMLVAAQGDYDHVVAMDSLIHYQSGDMVKAILLLASSARSSVLFTFAPRTPALAVMHAAGRLLPRGDRAPAIEPVSPARLSKLIAAEPGLADWRIARQSRISSGFYVSEAMKLVRR